MPNKRPGEPADKVTINMALFRFAEVETDLLISLNTTDNYPDVLNFFTSLISTFSWKSKEDFLALLN